MIRGATVMRGYWEKPEATAKRLRPGPLPGELVLYTGDFCRLDEEGYLYFVGRMDDIIKSRGEKVAPKEVENALVEHPGREGGGRDRRAGRDPRPGGQGVRRPRGRRRSSTRRTIQRECQRRLENFMVPKHVVFVPELPKTTTGKIKKTGLS